MTHHEQDEQTEHPKPRDRSHHDETTGQPAAGIPDGSGTNTGANDDTAEDTASGGPAD